MEPGLASPAATESRPRPGGWRQGVNTATSDHWSHPGAISDTGAIKPEPVRIPGARPALDTFVIPATNILMISCLCLAAFVTHSRGPVTRGLDAFAVMTSRSHHC